MIGVCGGSSRIAEEFLNMIPEGTSLTVDRPVDMRDDCEAYLICTGYLAGEPLAEMSTTDSIATWHINFAMVAQFCERILAKNLGARICVIGSESAFAGSYDAAYAAAKAGLHSYVETRKVRSEQMLVAVAPHIVWDTEMTQSRDDLFELEQRGERNRTGRWLSSAEVAQTAFWLLREAPVSLSNQIIRMRP